MGELWVKLLAEFARPAGAGIEAIHYGGINVFHERGSSAGETDAPSCDLQLLTCGYNPIRPLIEATLYYMAGISTSPL